MIKYKPDSVSVVFEEVPDYVTLAIEITNCPGHCEGCHSPWLREDIGEELTPEVLDELINKNKGVNCICFMGEGKDPEGLKKLAEYVKSRNSVPYVTALYSGREDVEEDYDKYFDFIKVGPYIAEYGPLNKETTNQHLYKINKLYDPETYYPNKWIREDITYKFWKKI